MEQEEKERINQLFKYLAREIAANRAYIGELRGEGNFLDNIESEEGSLLKLVEETFTPIIKSNL